MPVLKPAHISDRTAIVGMLGPYLAELSPQTAQPAEYPYLDRYWEGGQSRWPYLILNEAVIAGFVLVNRHSLVDRPTDFAIAEFYIAPEHRRNGLGSAAFHEAISTHTGQWELCVSTDNQNGQPFWAKLLRPLKPEIIKTNLQTIYRFRSI